MKRYLADILTLIRLILAVALLMLGFTDGSRFAAFLLFVLGELTDAFDGTCATKWPFPKNRTPKYRKYAAKYDMWIDSFLALSMIVFFTVRVNLAAGLSVIFGYVPVAIVIDFIVYGRLFGHPDDFTPHSLSAKNFPLSKTIILTRRRIYLALIALVAAWTLYASEIATPAKIGLMILAVIISVFLWFFLSERRHHISRDAVKIEDRLTRKASK